MAGMEMTHSIEIERPPDVVWRYLDDPEKQKLWMKGLVSNEPTDDRTGVGSRFKMRIKQGRRISEYEGEVLTYDAPRHLGIKFWGGCMKNMPPMHVDYTLTDLGGRTRVDYKSACEGGGLGWRIMWVLFRWIAKMQIKGFFATMKRLAEEESSPAATTT